METTTKYIQTVEQLKSLMASGEFHHATYRNANTVWEGLYIYRKSKTGLRGFEYTGAFNKTSAELIQAMNLAGPTGISYGFYGR